MNCWHCNKSILGKSWNHLKDIKDVSEDGHIVNVEKHICGYTCYKRLRESNTLPQDLWSHIVNKEDYKGLISPVIPRKNTFQFLTHAELKNMDEEDVDKYYQERDELMCMNPDMINIHDEQLKEDQRTEYLERESSCEENFDDY
jgi:hypothetical protein